MTRIDLHAHTEHSDGTLPPAALVRLARDVGLALLAVTDHDTTSGFTEAQAAGRTLGVEILAGCEVSTRIAQGNVHVLAYDFEVADAGFQSFLATVRSARDRRNERMFERLAALGVPVTHADVEAHMRGRIMARPHFARALVSRGHVPDVRTAFGQYLRDGGPAYVQAEGPPPEAAVRAIRAAGGVAVLAHPGQVRLPDRAAYPAFFALLRSAGLAGVEVQHTSQDNEQRAFFADLARQHDLIPSGGSDFHGDNKPHVRLGSGDGTIDVRLATWEALSARRAPTWS